MLCASLLNSSHPKLSTLDAAGEKWVSLAVSWTAEEAWCSFTCSSSHPTSHPPQRMALLGPSCVTLGKVGKVKLFLLSTLMCPNSYFSLHWSAGTSPLETQTSINALLSVVTAQVEVIQMLLDHGQEGLEPVHKLLKSPQSGWRSIFLLFDAQVDETLDPLAYDAGSQTLTKPLLFMDGCQIFVVEKRRV